MPAKKPTQRRKAAPKMARIYTLEVFVFSGPMTEEFIDRNPEISRTIEVRGTNTLDQLHGAIFRAFDRFDSHFYEFQFGAGPMRPENRRIGLPSRMYAPFASDDEDDCEDATRTTIDSLGLEVGRPFGYWFDFGDDWWHQIDVVNIEEQAPEGRYPKITARVGESPPQYIDDEEGDEESEEEEADE